MRVEFEVNGKLWERVSEPCDRCGGKGYSTEHSWMVNGGTCFKCGGSGKQMVERRILSPKEIEQRAKAKVRRDEKASIEREAQRKANIIRNNENFKKDKFFGAETLHVVSMDNTFTIKEELRSQGARWSGSFQRWCFTTAQEEYATVEIAFEDVVIVNEFGGYEMIDNCKDAVTKMVHPNEPIIESNYVGNIGDRLSLELTVERIHSFEGAFGETYIYNMVDAEGNIFVWFTGSGNLTRGLTYTMMAKIKDQSEYEDVKQNIITRPTKIVIK